MNASLSPPREGSVGKVILWGTFIFGVFFLAQPLDLWYSTRGEGVADENVKSVQSGSMSRELGLVALGVFGASMLILGGPRRLHVRGWLGWAILAFLFWAAASVAWSDAPWTTARRLALFAFLCAGAMGIARRFSFDEIMLLTFLSCTPAMILGLAAEIGLGTFQPQVSDYRHMGLAHPAITAWLLALVVLAAMALRRRLSRGRLWLDAAMILALPLMALTKARADVAGFVLAALVYLFTTSSPRRRISMVCLLGLSLAVLCLAADTLGEGIESLSGTVNLGREQSSVQNLTGRKELWLELLPFVKERFWCGYGYESFWSPDRLLDFSERVGWPVSHAHNGLLSMVLHLGIIGGVLFALVLILAMARALTGYLATARVGDAFALAVLTFLCVDISVSTPMQAPYLPLFLTMSVVARLGFVSDAPDEIARAGPPSLVSARLPAVKSSASPVRPVR